jgi:hypothetical protein
MKLFQMKRIFGEIKMTWTTILKNEQEWELREQKQRREDKAASYDKPPKRQKAGLGGRDKCKIETCYAVTCKYNKDKDCILPVVTLSSNAHCQDFTPEGENLSTKE